MGDDEKKETVLPATQTAVERLSKGLLEMQTLFAQLKAQIDALEKSHAEQKKARAEALAKAPEAIKALFPRFGK